MPTVNRPVRPWMQQGKPKPKSNARQSSPVAGGLSPNFYRCAPWRRLRDEVFREEPLCRICFNDTPHKMVEAMELDHIHPIRFGGAELDKTNTQPLCRSCHSSKSATEKHMTAAQWDERYGTDYPLFRRPTYINRGI